MTEAKAVTVIDSVRKMEPEFKLALPNHIPSERFTRIAISAINSNADLLDPSIDRRSLYAAVMKAAQDGLVIDGREAALVTFKSKDGVKAQYLPMVAGVLKKMRNSGEISNIGYGIVYKKEYEQKRFEYIKGDNESLRHEPILFEDKGPMIGVYAVVTLKDGAKVREFMDMKQIEKVRAVSRSAKSEYGPWVKWFEEMAVKSVLRKVSKLCPMSSDIDQVFRNDDEIHVVDEHEEPVNIQPSEPEMNENTTRKKRTRAGAKVMEVVSENDTIQQDNDYIDAVYSETQENDLPI